MLLNQLRFTFLLFWIIGHCLGAFMFCVSYFLICNMHFSFQPSWKLFCNSWNIIHSVLFCPHIELYLQSSFLKLFRNGLAVFVLFLLVVYDLNTLTSFFSFLFPFPSVPFVFFSMWFSPELLLLLFWAAAPKAPMTYAYTYGEICPASFFSSSTSTPLFDG